MGMRERAELLGGKVETGRRGGSYRVHARLPWWAAGREERPSVS